MVRSNRVLTVALAMTFLPLFCMSASAQSKKAGEFIPGTVVSIEKAKTGNNYKMKFKSTADDEEFDVTIGPRTQLLVSGKGDEGFLRPNVFVQTRVIVTNNEWFAGKFTIILGGNPPTYVKPDATEKTVFDVSGKITMTDTMGMIVQVPPQPKKISFEAAKDITVKIADPSLVKEGDTVEVEGTLIKSKKTINAVAVNVTSSADINSDEYFASLEERKKSKTTKGKATAKSKTDGEAGAGTGTDADPFGVLKKKGTKAKDDKAADGDAKKDDAKKDDAKKGDAEKKDGDAKKEEPKKDQAAKKDEA